MHRSEGLENWKIEEGMWGETEIRARFKRFQSSQREVCEDETRGMKDVTGASLNEVKREKIRGIKKINGCY